MARWTTPMSSFFQRVEEIAESFGQEAATAAHSVNLPGRVGSTAPLASVAQLPREIAQVAEEIKPLLKAKAEQIVGTVEQDVRNEVAKMTSPIAVAGLADTVKNAIAGMARAKAAAANLNASSGKLVGNIATIESLTSQLDDANTQLEASIEAVGGPLPGSDSGDTGGTTGNTTTAPANTSEPPPATASAPVAAGAATGQSEQSAARTPTQQAPATETAAAQVAANNAANQAQSPSGGVQTAGVATSAPAAAPDTPTQVKG